jgi:uncharacterized membrane protein YsdA (DUF1294 family)
MCIKENAVKGECIMIGLEAYEWLLLYFFLVNLISLFLFGLDKKRARSSARRIPERILFLWAIIGGAPGGWTGMYMFRHKTRHLKFTIGFPLIILFQLGLIYYISRAGI